MPESILNLLEFCKILYLLLIELGDNALDYLNSYAV